MDIAKSSLPVRLVRDAGGARRTRATPRGWRTLLVLLCGALGWARAADDSRGPREATPDVIVVGAGIAGLSAALEAGRGGAKVLVVDMASVFGGHAVMAQGLLNIVATPDQAAQGIEDSPELAARDFLSWGEDADAAWVRYYTQNSRVEVFDWLTGMGVRFENIGRPPGNSVARAHSVQGRGIALVASIYRECLETPTISFRWNVRLDALTRRRGGAGIGGVRVTELRTGRKVELEAGTAVVVATGGFQSNLDLVRSALGRTSPDAGRILAGGGANATGSALAILRDVGAVTARLDHQWNYLTGLPDPRFPGSERGVLAFVPSMWVNARGERFMAENASPKEGLPVVFAQPGGTFWAVFGPNALRSVYVSGSDWGDYRRIEELIINNPSLVKRGDTLAELGAKTGLPVAALQQTLKRFNALVATGTDEDFHAFDQKAGKWRGPVTGPPFYALQFFPLARKSLGGVVIDASSRVLDGQREPIPGLFAVGEVSGFGGINGKAGLEGTFLGPALVQGRVAARAILAESKRSPAAPPAGRETITFREADAQSPQATSCLQCHALPEQVKQARPGFWHFEKVHQAVLARPLSCTNCHAEITKSAGERDGHRIEPKQLMLSCGLCHQGESRE